MKKGDESKNILVSEYLENISRNIIKRYPEIVTEYARRRSGVYALYKGDSLYYVGLAKNMKSRLNEHLKDRHVNEWDRFSIYLTRSDEHIKELESLVLRIAAPKGNRIAGKFMRARDLRSVIKNRIIESQKRERYEIISGEPPRVSHNSLIRRTKCEYDTIICPGHKDGFDEEFISRNRWYAIRISKKVIPRLKYIALYITNPVGQITHYGRIRAIKPWRDSGKYIVHLRGKAKRLGPIVSSSKISMQGPRFALMARVLRARNMADLF